jgi:hypothetical protein
MAWKQTWAPGGSWKGNQKGKEGGSSISIKPPGSNGAAAKPGLTTTPSTKPTPPASKAALTVSTNSKKNELGVQTLVGDYTEVGMNHGKKYYKKLQTIPGHAEVKVFLYYWDNRDGADSSGWWFGDQLGGTEVWARAVSTGNVPPAAGWKVPWNAMKPEPGLLVVMPFKGATATPDKPAIAPAAGAPAGAAVKPAAASTDPRVKKATALVDSAENLTKPHLAKAKSLNKDSAPEAIKLSQENLQKHIDKFAELQKSLTQDIAEARKAGPTGLASITELSKLSPRIRTASTNLTAELNKLKGLAAAAVKNTVDIKKLEEKQKKEFDEWLPTIQVAVTGAVDVVQSAVDQAAPIINDPPDEAGDALKKILEEIDQAAVSAQTKVNEARQKLTTKMALAQKFAPEAKKIAVAEFTLLQNKLVEEQKKLDPVKRLKNDFTKRVEAKKALVSISEKLSDAELEAEKAAMLTTGADKESQMSEEDVKSGETLVANAVKALKGVITEIDAKMKGASGPLKDELTSMRQKVAQKQGAVNKVSAGLRSQREGLALQSVYTTAHEKVDKAEEALAKCADAELPFLKGIEVLPQEESDKAIKESEEVSSESNTLLTAARSYLSSKMAEIKKYSKETQEKASEELSELTKKVEDMTKKLNTFKKDTLERKVAAVMAEAVDLVIVAEGKGKTLTEAGSAFSGSLEDTSIEVLKEAIEKTAAAEKVVSEAVSEARKAIGIKQKASKDKEVQNGLTKLSNRLNAVGNEIQKVKKAAGMGERLVKGKELSAELDTKLTDFETQIEALVKQANPEDDGLGVETISDESVLEVDSKTTSIGKELKSVQSSISTFLSNAPPASKAIFTKLSERTKGCQTKIEDVKKTTKPQREKVLCGVYLKECTEKTAEVETVLEKLGDAEAPYLKGVECLPLEESQSSLKACDEAATAVQAAVNTARSLISSKTAALKTFDAAIVKDALAELPKLTERINSANQQLGQFKKDTDGRKKTALLQEAGVKVTAVGADVVKVADYIKPLAEKDAEALSSEEAAKIVGELEELEKAAKSSINETRNFLAARQKDAGADKDKQEQVKELQAKLATAQADLATAKKEGSAFIDKIKAKALIQEAANKLKEIEAEIEKANAACVPLLEEKGERFLVKQSLATCAAALRSYMAEKEVTVEELMALVGTTQAKFTSFLAKMPEQLSREECSFSAERQIAMFKSADVDGDSKLSADEFKAILTQRYQCVNGISVTEGYDISESKTLCKLEKGDLVESMSEAKKDEKTEMPRVKCKVVSSGEEGWVTLKGNGGATYLELITPISQWLKELDATLATIEKSCNKISAYFSSKVKELGAAAKDSPLGKAKEELTQTGSKVSSQIQALGALKKKTQQGRNDYYAAERKQKNAHIEAKEQLEADALLAVAKPAIEAMEAQSKKLEEVSKPLVEKLSTPDLLAEFTTPITTTDEAKIVEEALKAAVEEARVAIKKQQEEEAIKKAQKGPVLEAKKELQKWLGDCTKIVNTANKTLASCKTCCNSIAEAKVEKVGAALRADLKGVSVEDYFGKFAEGDKISEEAFCKRIESFADLKLAPEQAKLVATHIDADGVSRRAFMKLVQEYMKVVKDIAITPNFEITDTKEKMVRKANADEIMEVVEGPTKDEKSTLERVKVKAVLDGAEGWMSVKGNQGKQFLEKVEKPFYSCNKNLDLAKDFESKGEPVRSIKAEEVVELLEGPRSQILGSAMRARVKVSKDNKVGFVTVTDPHGNVLVEKNSTIYTCVATVAITDVFDISACKVLRKMNAAEVFTMSEGPVSEDSSGITRVKGKSSKDGIEGWVTITGNAGTVFAKLNEKLYTVKKTVALEDKFPSDSTALRTLEEDEALEILDAPKEEKHAPVERMKIRACDGAIGWITVKSGTVKKFSPTCKSLKATSLYTAKGMKESVVREVMQAEILQILEGPLEVEGVMWVKGKLKKDGAVGWALIKEEKGARLWGQ